MPKRKSIPESVVADVLIGSRRHCCLCFHFDGILEKCDGQIAHIDRDPSNSHGDNLAWLCLKHHEEYDRIPSTSKRMTASEVRKAREVLCERLSCLPIDSDVSGGNESLVFFEVTIPGGDLSNFTEAEQAEILQALGKLARIRSGVHLLYKRRGSIKLGIGVTEEEANRLLAAFESGRLRELGISEVNFRAIAYSMLLKKLKIRRIEMAEEEAKQRQERLKGEVESELPRDLPKSSPEGDEVGRAIRECISQLPRPRRLAVALHLQGHSVSDIGRLMSWNQKKADHLVYKGLADLRDCLKAKNIGP